jgi:O-antigen/teichoic acid export membrane protein
MALLGLPMVAGLILLGHPIIEFIGGARYTESGTILQILALALLGIFLGSIFGHMAVATNNQQRTLWIYALTAVLTLAGYFIMIPRFGIYGAAWMSVFSEWFSGILLCLTLLYFTKEHIDWIPLFKIVTATLGMSIVIHFTRAYLHIILLIPLAMAVYAGLVLLLRVIKKETLRELLPLQKTTS